MELGNLPLQEKATKPAASCQQTVKIHWIKIPSNTPSVDKAMELGSLLLVVLTCGEHVGVPSATARGKVAAARLTEE